MGTRVRMKIETPGTRRKREEMLRGLYEENLRIASLTLDRETMIRAFGWDPEERGR